MEGGVFLAARTPVQAQFPQHVRLEVRESCCRPPVPLSVFLVSLVAVLGANNNYRLRALLTACLIIGLAISAMILAYLMTRFLVLEPVLLEI